MKHKPRMLSIYHSKKDFKQAKMELQSKCSCSDRAFKLQIWYCPLLLFRTFNFYHLAFKYQCRQTARVLFIFKCPWVHLCGPVFSLLTVKLHLLGQGHLVELINVKYLKSKTFTRKQCHLCYISYYKNLSPYKEKGLSHFIQMEQLQTFHRQTTYSWLN